MFITKRANKSGKVGYERVKRMVLTSTGEAREETKEEMLLRLSHENGFMTRDVLATE